MNQNEKRLELMRTGKIPAVLWKLGMPTIIGMMVSALYNVVDTYFVGGLGTSQMGAVAIVFPIAQVIIGLGMTFGSGAASYVSRLLGEGKRKQADETAITALITSLLVGVVVIVISLCFLDNILTALGATPTILPFARAYALIYISGSIFNIFNVTMNNIVTAEGATRLTMTAMLMGGILNVILDPIFIYPLGFGISGAAIATIISQAVTSAMYIGYIVLKKGALRFSIRNFAPSSVLYMEVLKIGVPTFIFQLLTSAAIGLTNTAASKYGDAAVAAMGIATRVLTLGTFVIFGYMKGFQPVAGYNYGAKLYNRLREAVRISLKYSTLFCCTLAAAMLFFAPSIIGLFSQGDAQVIEIGSKALRANAVMFAFFGYMAIYMSLYLALGRGMQGSILSISRQGLFFIPAIFILPALFGLNGIVFAQPIADLFTLILTFILAIKLNKELKMLSKD